MKDIHYDSDMAKRLYCQSPVRDDIRCIISIVEDSSGMGHFIKGDVIIAQVPCFGRTGAKIRPAVVIGSDQDGALLVVPVSSKPSTDMPSLPLSLDDFRDGGLDMFNESYILFSQVSTIQPRNVVGKRGHLTNEFTDRVIAGVTAGIYKNKRL